jgi:DNA mismatch repair protein MutH
MILRADGKDVVGFGKLALEAAAGSPPGYDFAGLGKLTCRYPARACGYWLGDGFVECDGLGGGLLSIS